MYNIKQSLNRPRGLQKVETPRNSRQLAHVGGKVVSPMHQPPLPPGDNPGTYLCYRLSQLLHHSVARRIKSMKNSNDPIGNRTNEFPGCYAVPQPTVPPYAKLQHLGSENFISIHKRINLLPCVHPMNSNQYRCLFLWNAGTMAISQSTKQLTFGAHTHTHTHTHARKHARAYINSYRKREAKIWLTNVCVCVCVTGAEICSKEVQSFIFSVTTGYYTNHKTKMKGQWVTCLTTNLPPLAIIKSKR